VDECADWRERGNDAYEREAYEEATRCFTRAIDAGPGDARSFSNRSACFMKLKRYSQALSDAERAVTLDGNWAKARTRVGAAALAMGRFDLAERAFGLALKLDPTSQTAQQGLVQVKETVARAERSRKSTVPMRHAPEPPSATRHAPEPPSATRHAPEPPSVPVVRPSAHRDALIHEARSLMDRLEEILSAVRTDVERLSTSPATSRGVEASCQTTERKVRAETFATDFFGIEAKAVDTNNCANRVVVPRFDGDDSDDDENEEDDVETSQMARLLQVASGENAAGEDASTLKETEETLVTDTLKFFEEFERHVESSDDDIGEVHVSAETSQDDEKWAERWEAEQFTTRERKADREKILLENVQKRQSTESGPPRPPGLKSDSLGDLFKAQERFSGAMGDADAEGEPRGPCRICGDACTSFARMSTWKRPPLPKVDPESAEFASLYHSVALGLDGARCARCGCESSSHCTEKEFRKRERMDRAKEAKKQSKQEDRKARVRIAAERVQKARDQCETVIEMTCDGVLSAERRECTTCADCPGFRLIFPQSQATVPDVVCFCSMCGCPASDHVICENWSRQRDASRERYERHARAEQQRRAAKDARSLSTSFAQHYQTLGISSSATQREISKAYRRAALRWHPDKHSHKVESERRSATNMFIRVADAFKALCGDRPT